MIDNLPYAFFYFAMGLASLGWLLLLVFPRHPLANFWMSGIVIPGALSLLYVYMLITFWFRSPPGVFTAFLTLEGVHGMFDNRGLLLVAWINILIVDLVVGAWMARKAAQIRMPYLYLAPCLLLTFGFAGVGFILYSVVLAVGGRWQRVAELDGEPREFGWT